MADIRKPLNVFAQSVNIGQIAEISAAGPPSQTVMLIDTSVEELTPGLPVKLVTGSSEVPLVELADPSSDDVYGLVIYNPKQSTWVAKDLFQVTTKGTVLFLESNTTLARGAQVGLDPTTNKLIAATSTNYIGQLLDDAIADQIVRVELAIPLTVAP